MARVKLCDVIVRANTKVDKDNTNLIYYVGGEHFESGNVTVENKGLIAGSTIGPMFYYGFKRGQFLLVSRNPHLKKAGVVDFDGICSEKTFVLETANPSVLLPEYLPFVLQNDTFWNYAVEHKHGSTNFFINWSTLANYEFELPSLEVQKHISKLAWAAHNLKKSYRKQLVATDDLVKSQFIEMFGNLGKDEKGWGITTIGNCCLLNPKRPKGISNDLMVSFVPMPAVSEDGLINSSDIKPYADVKKGFTYFAEDDVLFAKITPCMENGKGAVAQGLYNGIGAGSTEFHVLRPIEGVSNPYWLYIITRFDSFRAEARKVMTGTGGQLRVPIGFLENYPISLPPISLQAEFEVIVQQSDKSKFVVSNRNLSRCLRTKVSLD